MTGVGLIREPQQSGSFQQSEIPIYGPPVPLQPCGEIANRYAPPGLHLTQQSEPLCRKTLGHIFSFSEVDDDCRINWMAGIQLLRLSLGPFEKAFNSIGVTLIFVLFAIFFSQSH